MVAKKAKKQIFDLQGSVANISTDVAGDRFLITTVNNDAVILGRSRAEKQYEAARCIKQEHHGLSFITCGHLLQGTSSDAVIMGAATGAAALLTFSGDEHNATPHVSSFSAEQKMHADNAIVDVAQFHGRPSFAWCNSNSCYVSDASRNGDVIATLDSVVPGIVGVVATGRNELAIAAGTNVLLYDLRAGVSPTTAMDFDDIFTAIDSDAKGNITCGTAMGRMVRMRGTASATCREEAFGVSKRRCPITSMSVLGDMCACGDDNGRVSMVDLQAEDAQETQTWGANGAVAGVGLAPHGLLSASFTDGGTSELSLLPVAL